MKQHSILHPALILTQTTYKPLWCLLHKKSLNENKIASLNLIGWHLSNFEKEIIAGFAEVWELLYVTEYLKYKDFVESVSSEHIRLISELFTFIHLADAFNQSDLQMRNAT